MGKKKGGKSPKDPYSLVAPEVRDAIAQSSPEEIKARICELTLLGLSQKEMQEKDDKLTRAKNEHDALLGPYKDDAKALKQAITYCKQVLGDKGKDTSGETAMREKPKPAPVTRLPIPTPATVN